MILLIYWTKSADAIMYSRNGLAHPRTFLRILTDFAVVVSNCRISKLGVGTDVFFDPTSGCPLLDGLAVAIGATGRLTRRQISSDETNISPETILLVTVTVNWKKRKHQHSINLNDELPERPAHIWV